MTGTAYRLLTCDLDGTILQHHRHVSRRVQAALVAAREQGVQVTLATGRSYHSALPHAQALDIHLPLVCYQGGLIQRVDDGEVLHRNALAPELVEETIRLGDVHGWQLIIYTADKVYITEYRYSEDFYLETLGPTVRQVPDLMDVVDGGPIKLTFLAPEDEVPAIEVAMAERFAGQMEIFCSHPMFVEGIPVGASKGSAVAWLAQYLGVQRSEVMAIGDQDNDASMVAWAGLGVAMGNGSERCQRAADWVAPAIDDDGAAVAIERFLL